MRVTTHFFLDSHRRLIGKIVSNIEMDDPIMIWFYFTVFEN
jgi:hypothetical protein